MRKFAVPAIITACGVGLLLVLAIALSGQGTNASIDSKVSRGQYPVMPGAKTVLPVLKTSKTESVSDLKGKVVLVNVFAGWCTTCYAEAPLLRKAEAELKAHGGTVLGVTYQDSSGNAEGFMQKYGVDYPVLHDASNTISTALGVTAVPESFLINRQGKIQALVRNEMTPAWLQQHLPKILNENA